MLYFKRRLKSRKAPRELVFWTDIATPYRAAFYNCLQKYDLHFNVWYMLPAVRSRAWRLEQMNIGHKYHVHNSPHLYLGKLLLYFDIVGVVKASRLGADDQLVLALSWNDPTVLLICFLKKLRFIKTKISFWSEANYLTTGSRNDNLAKVMLRRFVYSAADGVQFSSGQMTKLTFRKWGVDDQRYVDLPNTIDEGAFFLTDGELRLRKENPKLVMVICARIIEEIKGIINFVDSLGSVRLRKIQLVIAGDGPDRERLEAYIKEHFLSNDVMLVGDVQPARLREILASANLFCLPSFTDASPLAVVEALRMELPLLISNRCGNHYEAVCEGVNGYTFNPEDRRSVTKAFDSLPLSASDLNEMGQQSRKIYERTFRLDKVSERIANHFRLR